MSCAGLVLAVVLVLACALSASAMPYRVPLQGREGGKRTMVMVDAIDKVSRYSVFFEDLSARGHTLSVLDLSDSNAVSRMGLDHYGETLYDNLLILAPSISKFSKGNSGGISQEDILSFVREGGNVLIAGDRDMSDATRQVAELFGVHFDKKNFEAIDHFTAVSEFDTKLTHTTFAASNAFESPAVLGSFLGKIESSPVLFRGVGQRVERSSILAMPLLSGNPTTYSGPTNKYLPTSEKSLGASELALVTAVQGRNNARVVVAGSVDMFSNEFFTAKINGNASGNRAFAASISSWAFGERGVLRFRDVTHTKHDGTPPDVILHEKERPDLPLTLYPDPEITRNSLVYRIRDDITFSMVVEELVDGNWTPFSANDMQLEFVMLDPYVRTTLSNDESKGLFYTTFTAPDSYGIFKFRVLYRRPGYSVLHHENQVSLRPFKHDEYERFILGAYPYYASSFTALIAFSVFSLLFLFTKE